MSFTDEVMKRLKPAAETIVSDNAAALAKLLERDRSIHLEKKDIEKIRRSMRHQMKLHLEAFFQAVETVEAGELKLAGILEQQESVMEARASKLQHLVAFDETYMIADPKFSSQYLDRVEEKAFKAGLEKLERDRLLELSRWLSEIIKGE